MSRIKNANRLGIVVGSFIATLLICYQIILLQNTQSLTFSVIEGIIISGLIFGGAISGFIVEKYFVHKLTNKGSIISCIVGSILISPLSLYFAILFGASLVGGWGEIIGSIIGVDKLGSRIGMLIGITLAVVIVESIGAAIGSYVGRLGHKLIQKQGGSTGQGTK